MSNSCPQPNWRNFASTLCGLDENPRVHGEANLQIEALPQRVSGFLRAGLGPSIGPPCARFSMLGKAR